MRCLGYEHSDEDVIRLFNKIDEDRGGEIGFIEFADMWCGPETEISKLIKERCGELKALFNLFDKDKGGRLDLGEVSLHEPINLQPNPAAL